MDLPEIRKEIIRCQKERSDLELKCIRSRSKMEAGSVFERYTACQKGNCKCQRGELHGPFIFLGQKINGKTKTRYAGKESDKPTVKRVRAYMRYQDNLAKIRKITKKMDELFNTYRELMIEKE